MSPGVCGPSVRSARVWATNIPRVIGGVFGAVWLLGFARQFPDIRRWLAPAIAAEVGPASPRYGSDVHREVMVLEDVAPNRIPYQ